MNNLELLAPAGGPDKLKLAFLYGADAVYAGGRNLSLRNKAINFSDEELQENISFAHKMNKNVYIAVNIFAKNSDFEMASDYLKYLNDIKADGVIMTDPGLISLCKKVAPNLDIHLSTQANTLNKYTVRFWHDAGIKRVVLARELSLEEIKEIKDYNPEVELEAFVHGAMCISYSGRCLLSNYLTSRDANRGECVQVCRWKFKLTEVSKHSEREVFAEEDERGTYFLNSKDLNMLSGLGDLANAGVTSFKIEGRMKSEYYLATAVNAYRRAINELNSYGKIINDEKYQKELIKISNREYTKAYNYQKEKNTELFDKEQGEVLGDFVAVVRSYHDNYASLEMRNRFKLGDTIEVLSPNDSFLKTFKVTQIFNEAGEPVDDAKLVQHKYTIYVPFNLFSGDILRKI